MAPGEIRLSTIAPESGGNARDISVCLVSRINYNQNRGHLRIFNEI